MNKQYQAVRPIGRFKEGDIVGGLTDAEIKHHLAEHNIAEAKPTTVPTKVKTGEVKNGE